MRAYRYRRASWRTSTAGLLKSTPPSSRPPPTAAPRPLWRKNRAELVASRTVEAGKVVALKVQAAGVDGERKAAEADLGPVRYLATVIGATDEVAMRYFILVVALFLDPAAVLLLLAHSRCGATSKQIS